MAANLGVATAEAAKVAARMGSAAADAALFMGALGEELPLLQPVLKTLRTICIQVETVKSNNREELAALHERCTFLTAIFIVKCRESSTSEMETAPPEDFVEAVRQLVDRGGRRRRVFRVLSASRIKVEINGLNSRIDSLTSDVGLAGIATLERKADDLRAILLVRLVVLKRFLWGSSLLLPQISS